jgi:chromosome segregation ATPase
MAQQKPRGVGLTAAAEALERELQRYDALARDLERERLDSEKTLRRAAQTLDGLRDSEIRLRDTLAQLVGEISDARERQQAQAASVAACAEQVGRRSDVLSALLGRWTALGGEAAEVTRLVQRMAAEPTSNGAAAADLANPFDEIEQRLSRLAQDAEALRRAAAEESFGDLAKQADGLRQQVLGSLNKVRLAKQPAR